MVASVRRDAGESVAYIARGEFEGGKPNGTVEAGVRGPGSGVRGTANDESRERARGLAPRTSAYR